MSIRRDSTSVRRSAGVAWLVGLAATITGVVRTLDSIEQYHQPVMVLAAVGVAAAVVASVSSRRKVARVLAMVVAVIAAILFLLGWYAFAHQSENIGPYCGG